jgi:hypothetical protein
MGTTLYKWPEQWGLPSLSVGCMHVEVRPRRAPAGCCCAVLAARPPLACRSPADGAPPHAAAAIWRPA